MQPPENFLCFSQSSQPIWFSGRFRPQPWYWQSKSGGDIDCNKEQFQLPVISIPFNLMRLIQIKQHNGITFQLPVSTSTSYLEQWLRTLLWPYQLCRSISKQHHKIKLYIWRWLKENFSASLDLSNEKVYKMGCLWLEWIFSWWINSR